MECLKEDPVSDDDVITKLSSMLECPVCFNVPRDLPIPQCSAGHIVCKSCKASVTSCPTCRREMSDSTSSLAASMIDLVPHKCKFAEYGCEVKDLLVHLIHHEEKCAERTVRCPSDECRAEIQLKKFEKHAIENDCRRTMTGSGNVFIHTFSAGFMKWDGISKNRGEEFDLDEEVPSTRLFDKEQRVFIVRKYFPI